MVPLSSKYPGVYAIFNRITGKVYVGSASRSLKSRTNAHLKLLLRGEHPNRHLQRSWNKHGKEAFECIEMEQCNSDDCIIREQWWMDELGAFGPKGYNECPKAGSRYGTKHTDETKKKISEANTGKKHTEETKAKMSEDRKGRMPTDEHRKALVENHWSKSEDAKKIGNKISKGLGRRLVSGRTRTNIQFGKLRRKMLSGKGKLSKKHIREILIKYHTNNISRADLAKEYKASHSTICCIVDGTRYPTIYKEVMAEINQ